MAKNLSFVELVINPMCHICVSTNEANVMSGENYTLKVCYSVGHYKLYTMPSLYCHSTVITRVNNITGQMSSSSSFRSVL